MLVQVFFEKRSHDVFRRSEQFKFLHRDENPKTKTEQIHAIGAKLHHVTKIRTLLDVVPTTTTTIVAPTRHRFSLSELRETMQKTDCIQIARHFLSFLI
mmetsp:Transcript_8815/g.17036  ORF Transcript_8815/g.17036 Transcript_8815/m.17036 type:complete len:99 (-) Transcript_8815:274-570(-)